MHAGRDAIDNGIVRYIARDDGTSPNGDVWSDGDVWQNSRIRTDETVIANRYAAGERGSRGEVNAFVELTFVIDNGTGIDDAVVGELDIDADRGAGQDVAAGAEASRGRDVGAGMNRLGKRKAGFLQMSGDVDAIGAAVAADCYSKRELGWLAVVYPAAESVPADGERHAG